MKFVAKKSDNEGASKSSIAKQNMAFWDGETIRMSVWYFIEGGDIRKNLNFTKEALIKNQPLVELLIKVGEKHQATPGQVALAWLMAKKPFIVPIPGARIISHMQENGNC